MAFTATSLQTKVGFAVNATSDDASGCEELVAAVTGKKIKLEKCTIHSAAAISVTIGAGETAGAVTSPVIGPVYMAANTSVIFDFTRPIELAAATALVVDASGAGNICVFVQGIIE